jgi:hypothetical protein
LNPNFTHRDQEEAKYREEQEAIKNKRDTVVEPQKQAEEFIQSIKKLLLRFKKNSLNNTKAENVEAESNRRL